MPAARAAPGPRRLGPDLAARRQGQRCRSPPRPSMPQPLHTATRSPRLRRLLLLPRPEENAAPPPDLGSRDRRSGRGKEEHPAAAPTLAGLSPPARRGGGEGREA